MRGTRIANNHLIVGLKTLEGDILNTVGFVLGFGFGDDWRTRNQGVVDSRVRNQISLEFGEIDVQGPFESEGCGDG